MQHDERVRVYVPISVTDIDALKSNSMKLQGRIGIGVTAEFAKTVETDEPDELDLIAAMAASDLSVDSRLVLVVETSPRVIDAELGDVQVQVEVPTADYLCLLIADVEAQELSWFGVQEFDRLPDFTK